jgi:hypothetical protein
MPHRPAFAPYRIPPGVLPEEASRAAAERAAGPLLASSADALPAPLVAAALAELPVGRAASEAEACRAADGAPSGLGAAPRACLTSARHLARVEEAARAALAAGFAGILLDRPDASLAQGLLGAGFCDRCQQAFLRDLTREYGEPFQALDYQALVREALASASGAVGYAALPFGGDFWRFRHDSLERAVRAQARAARDAARAVGRPFTVAAWFEAVGPAQLQAARHVDAGVFPAAEVPARWTGLLALLRAAFGRRPVAVAAPPELAPVQLMRLAGLAACFGVGLASPEVDAETGRQLKRLRGLVDELSGAGHGPAGAAPVTECAILYSAEADLWTSGRHRRAVELAAAALSSHQVQATVVLAPAEAPPLATLVLAGAEGVDRLEARELSRRLEAGGSLLVFGEATRKDELGRGPATFLPAGKPGGARTGGGLVAQLPPLVGPGGADAAVGDEVLDKALVALLGKGRRALGLTGRARLSATLWRCGATLTVHLTTSGAERSQGNTLFLGQHVAGGHRRARFRSAEGVDVEIRLNPSGYSVSTVLPAFSGYAVLEVGG